MIVNIPSFIPLREWSNDLHELPWRKVAVCAESKAVGNRDNNHGQLPCRCYPIRSIFIFLQVFSSPWSFVIGPTAIPSGYNCIEQVLKKNAYTNAFLGTSFHIDL